MIKQACVLICSRPCCRVPWAQRHRAAAAARAASGLPAEAPAPAPVHFSELPLDRAAALRTQPEQLQRLLGAPGTRLVPLSRGRALVAPADLAAAQCPLFLQLSSGAQLRLAPHSFAGAGVATAEGMPPHLLPLVLGTGEEGGSPAALHAALAPSLNPSLGFVFLGLAVPGGHAVFACELAEPAAVVAGGGSSTSSGRAGAPSSQAPSEPSALAAAAVAVAELAAALVEQCQWAEVRSAGQGMTGGDAAVLALAAGLAKWHGSAAFCGRSGRPTVGGRLCGCGVWVGGGGWVAGWLGGGGWGCEFWC